MNQTLTQACLCGCGKPINSKIGGQKWALGCAPNFTKKKIMPLAYEPMVERPKACGKCQSPSIYQDEMIDQWSSGDHKTLCWRCVMCGWAYFLSPGTALEGNYVGTRAPRPRKR